MNKESLTIAIAQSYLDMLAPPLGRLPSDLTIETLLNYKIPDDEPRTFDAVVTVWRNKMDRCCRLDVEFIGELKEPQGQQEPIALSAAPNTWDKVIEAVRESEDWQEYDYLCHLMLHKIQLLEAKLK